MKKLFRSFGFGFAIKLLEATEMSGVFFRKQNLLPLSL